MRNTLLHHRLYVLEQAYAPVPRNFTIVKLSGESDSQALIRNPRELHKQFPDEYSAEPVDVYDSDSIIFLITIDDI